MDLLVVRHGPAGEREDWPGDDDLRPLTDDGIVKMRKAAQGLHTLIERVDILAASPLVRAQQTAEIVAKALRYSKGIETVDALRPEQDPLRVLEWLRQYGAREMIAIAGHEPHLSTTVWWLLSERRDPRFELKKGGACLLRFDDSVEAGTAELLWLLTPTQLRALAR
jgi:phosphohistidine phosphatase